MPTYEYACKTCDQHVEVVQSFTDEPLTTCEACGGALRRVIHAAGIMFKGSGFYSTDRRAAARAQSRSHGKEGEKSSSSAEGDSNKDAPKKDASKNGSGDKSSDKVSSSSGDTTNKKAAEKSA